MKLYRHYKNKNYKYIGEARHSESLDEVIIYETLYEHDLGKIWVRPKKMFSEPVTIGDESLPRFRPIELKIHEFTDIQSDQIDQIAVIMEEAFGEWDPKWFFSKFDQHRDLYLCLAFVEGQIAGFKLGYRKSSQTFYSWLGGVVPDYRGLGIATDLLKQQHDWCRQQGYKTVQTKTQNRFRSMLLLNIQSGFDVIGFEESDEAGPKIILEKNLMSAESEAKT